MNEPSYVLYNVLATVPYFGQRTTRTNLAKVYKLKGIVANVKCMNSALLKYAHKLERV